MLRLAGVLGVTVAITGVALAMPAVIRMEPPPDARMPSVVFKHWKHQRTYKCYTCHPVFFSQWEKAVFDHGLMDEGRYCGACHNGETAFRPFDKDCEVCHVER